jgi:hypothetical protein
LGHPLSKEIEMSSTFTPPLRIGPRQTLTNAGGSSADATGAAVLSRQAAVAGGTATTIVIPAGSILMDATFYGTTAATSPATPNVTCDSVVVGTLSDGAGIRALTPATTTAAATEAANVGAADVTVSWTAGAGAVGVLSVVYTARNPDGTIIPYGSGYTNS